MQQYFSCEVHWFIALERSSAAEHRVRVDVLNPQGEGHPGGRELHLQLSLRGTVSEVTTRLLDKDGNVVKELGKDGYDAKNRIWTLPLIEPEMTSGRAASMELTFRHLDATTYARKREWPREALLFVFDYRCQFDFALASIAVQLPKPSQHRLLNFGLRQIAAMRRQSLYQVRTTSLSRRLVGNGDLDQEQGTITYRFADEVPPYSVLAGVLDFGALTKGAWFVAGAFVLKSLEFVWRSLIGAWVTGLLAKLSS